MPREDKLPPIPPDADLSRVPLPDLIMDPRLGRARRGLLFGTAKLATGLRDLDDEYNVPVARPYSLLLFGLPFLAAVVGIFTVEEWQYLLLLWLIAVGLLPLVVLSGVGLLVRGRVVRAQRSGHLVVPADDLDGRARMLLRAVLRAIDHVGRSRAGREGHLPGGSALLQDQRWRIASALARLSEARRLHESTGGRLAEHQMAVRGTERAIERRVRSVLAYAESVRELDLALGDIDAASHTHTLDDRLRETLAALGEEQSLTALAAESQDTRTAVEAALEVLRDRTERLRSSTEDEL